MESDGLFSCLPLACLLRYEHRASPPLLIAFGPPECGGAHLLFSSSLRPKSIQNGRRKRAVGLFSEEREVGDSNCWTKLSPKKHGCRRPQNVQVFVLLSSVLALISQVVLFQANPSQGQPCSMYCPLLIASKDIPGGDSSLFLFLSLWVVLPNVRHETMRP